eukprot:Gb_20282 [translate_table: standard]
MAQGTEVDYRSCGFSPPLHGSPPTFEQYLQLLNGHCSPEIRSSILEVTARHLTRPVPQKSLPVPPPPPLPSYHHRPGSRNSAFGSRFEGYNCVPKETVDTWDRLFEQGFKADVRIITIDGGIIAAHSNVLGVASPVLKRLLKQQRGKSLPRSISITGVPYDAVRTFLRFLYSARYIKEDMQKYALHLIVLAHVFCVPSLKRVCTQCLEQGLLTIENVIDVLQLARLCDTPALNLLCMRLILKNLKAVAKSEGWRIMQYSNPMLEQELLQFVAEAESQKEQRLRKIEEKKTYLQLHDAMEALLHICRDGCRTIGPHDKALDGNQDPCNFPTCKGLESLVRHFAACKMRVPGGCGHCKRMWQLLELHSRMCSESETCKVPLCMLVYCTSAAQDETSIALIGNLPDSFHKLWHFKEKMQWQSKKDEVKWNLLVSKVVAAKQGSVSFSSVVTNSAASERAV